jgi:hypothetical protein
MRVESIGQPAERDGYVNKLLYINNSDGRGVRLPNSHFGSRGSVLFVSKIIQPARGEGGKAPVGGPLASMKSQSELTHSPYVIMYQHVGS